MQNREIQAGGTQRHAAGLLALGGVLAGGMNYAYALCLTYRLPTSQYAIFAGAQSLVLINGVIGSAGVPWVLARETAAADKARDPKRFEEAVTFAFWANLTIGLISAVIVAGLVLIFANWNDALLVGATVLVLATGSTGLGVMQGRGRTSAMSAVIVAEVMVKLLVGLFIVFGVGNTAGGALLGILAGGCVLLGTLPSNIRHVKFPRRLHTNAALWHSAARIGGLQVGVGIMCSLDTFLAASLAAVRGNGATYQVASTFGKVPLFISSAVSAAVFPTLAGPSAGQRRVEALRTYGLVAAFIWLTLLTIPSALVRNIFPSDYGSVARWLPYAAALGVALGLLNLLTTFVQSNPPLPKRGTALGGLVIVPAVLIMVGGIVAGAETHGLLGVAVGGLAAAWLSVLAFVVQPGEFKPALRALRGAIHPPRNVVLLVAFLLPMTLARQTPILWVPTATVTGLALLPAAFPEFRPVRRSRWPGWGTRRGS